MYILSSKYRGFHIFFLLPAAGLTNQPPVRDFNPGAPLARSNRDRGASGHACDCDFRQSQVYSSWPSMFAERIDNLAKLQDSTKPRTMGLGLVLYFSMSTLPKVPNNDQPLRIITWQYGYQ